MIAKLWQCVSEELGAVHPRLLLAHMLMSPLPDYVGNRLRVVLYRLGGLNLGKGTVVAGKLTLSGSGDLYKKLIVGQGCFFNVGCFLDLGERIEIGDGVGLGQQVMLLTTTHMLGETSRRVGGLRRAPIRIQNGAWLGARSMVLPGVNIGSGAVVAAGAVVSEDVSPDTIVGGVPAKILRTL